MALQNRVTPLGELIADPARGLVYGNRGCLHDAGGRIRRDFAVRRWIACRLEFRGWQRGPKMQPGRFTELFFLDDATALAAGHRPCALCRREDYNRLLGVWGRLHPDDHGADAIDLRLHDQRLDGRERRLHAAAYDELPDGAYVMSGDDPWLVWGDALLRWSAAGYHRRVPRPRRGRAQLLTPPSLVELLRDGRTGLVPLAHPSHGSAGCGTLVGVTRRIGLLRGINVGGRNRVPMAQLRELMEALGYTGVQTLLQSGNVVFGSKEPAATSERRIAERLHQQTGLDVKVLVRTRAEMAAVVKRNPLREHADNPKHHHVVFLSARPDPKLVAALDPADYEPEMFRLHGRELFMWWPAGVHKARLTHSFWERKLKVTATARNWNTVERLLELASTDGPV